MTSADKMVCAQCPRVIDLSRAHTASDGDDWCSCRVLTHGLQFCSMRCAEVWAADPRNAEVLAASYSKSNCSAYLGCVCDALMADLSPKKPPFTSCDAECPLRSGA